MNKFLELNRSTLALLAGYSIEKYDMFLYGFFIVIIGELFCPNNISNSVIFGLGVFAAGYLTRPLGGIVFGHLGDKLGRKKALLISIGLACIPPFLLSILPTYEQIGFLAPLILIIGRLVQGFCSGGEFSGASVFLQETNDTNKVAFLTCLLRSVGFFGVMVGTITGYLSTFPFMPKWSWRIPFVVGTVLTLALYFLRRKEMEESSLFQKVKETGEIVKSPLIGLLKKSKKRLACAMALSVYASISYYISTVYNFSLLKSKFNLPNYQIMAINLGVVCIWMVTIPIIGIWADKVGIKRFLTNSILWNILLIYPLFWFIERYFSFTNLILFQIILGLLSASFYAPFVGLLPRLFHVNEKYSGVAFSVTTIQAVFGGVAPLVSTLLVSFLGDVKAPAYILILSAIIAFVGVISFKRLIMDAERGLNVESTFV